MLAIKEDYKLYCMVFYNMVEVQQLCFKGHQKSIKSLISEILISVFLD